ncbi:MAG: PIN domain-containing protein [Saprospiraceae bacterium]|nr:PIN domain-containing protein [Saprospiraceae bacterium]
MKIVLDTNVLLQAISSRSEHYWIWEALRQGQLTLCITTDILLETRRFSPAKATRNWPNWPLRSFY